LLVYNGGYAKAVVVGCLLTVNFARCRPQSI